MGVTLSVHVLFSLYLVSCRLDYLKTKWEERERERDRERERQRERDRDEGCE